MTKNRAYMSFADLRLQTLPLELRAPEVVAENSSLRVSCSLQLCSGATPSPQPAALPQLCLPNRTCSERSGSLEIPIASVGDSGTYTCRFGSLYRSTSVSLLCDFPIRRSRVLHSWQSSFFAQTCFCSRSAADEDAIARGIFASYYFFHSHGSSQADGGFHWFAVQLKKPVLIGSVTVKAREDNAQQDYVRASSIEVWTSNCSQALFFGHDHCSSKNMSSQFSASQRLWRKCGVTEKKSAASIRAGEIFTVKCLAEVRHLLLRRPATAAGNAYMNFADLRLKTVEIKSLGPRLVAENSNFTVRCSVHCNGTEVRANSEALELCSPDGNCTKGAEINISSAGPRNAGTYTCRVGSVKHSATVSVLASSADPPVVAENCSFTVSCRLHGPKNSSEIAAFGPLQLCSPGNASCTTDETMSVSHASPQHAGAYTCTLGSTLARAFASVLYRPSNVSISVSNAQQLCSNPSAVKVNFNSATAQPQPEHECRIETDGGPSLTIIQDEVARESKDGTYLTSVWTFSETEKFNPSHEYQLKCRALQNYSIKFTSELNETHHFDACQDDSPQTATILIVSIFCSVTIAVALAVAIFVAIGSSVGGRSTDANPIVPLQVTNTSADACVTYATLLQVGTSNSENGAASQLLEDEEQQESSCVYLTVLPRGAANTEEQEQQWDSDADSVEYIQIVADGY